MSTVDITPGGERHNEWQRMREETIFPAYREEMRKKLAGGTTPLSPDIGEYIELSGAKVSRDMFPEEHAALLNVLNSLHNKLNPDAQYPTDTKARYGLWTDSWAKPRGAGWREVATPVGVFSRTEDLAGARLAAAKRRIEALAALLRSLKHEGAANEAELVAEGL